MEIKSNEFTILRLPPEDENIIFLYHTFAITQYIFFDERFRSSQMIHENQKEFNLAYYNKLREKCFKINKSEVIFNINEFIFLAKTVDFVAKCLIGEPKDNLEKILNADAKSENFDYQFRDFITFYLTKSTDFFQHFRESCKNEKLLRHVSDALNWEIEI